jgi:hypothetical protein
VKEEVVRGARLDGIRWKTMWTGEVAAKGYVLEDFREAFRRYISKAEVEELRGVARGGW